MPLIFMFPGQNSRYPGMIAKFAALHPDSAALVERASAVLDRDVAACQFARNRDVQVGVFLASHLLLASLERAGIHADYSLGLSLGEYNHLVHIGALGFEDALRLLEARGDAYEASPPGVMASVAPISLAELEAAVREHGLVGTVAVALRNTPRQHVLSGPAEAVEAVLETLEAAHFIEPVFIDRRLAMHSPLFDAVATRFRSALEAIPFQVPYRPYLPNVLGKFLARPARAVLIHLLARHVHEPVLWRKSMEAAAAMCPGAAFVEVGPRAVLYGMMGRRWMDCPRYRTDAEENFSAHFEELVEELKVGQRDFAVADPHRQARAPLAGRAFHAAG